MGLLLLVSSTLAAGDALTDFSSERFHWRFMYFRDFQGPYHVAQAELSGIHQVSPWELRLAWENPAPLQIGM